tara:strand:+ start:2862 stop:3554 length:693 start_codon:yes stop_codon:yes gene_type:complete
MFKEFNTFIQPLKDRLENLLKYGKTNRITGADGALQKIQLSTLRNIEDALKIGQFGFNSKMPNGSRVVVAEISNEKIIIANEHIASIIDVTDGNTIIYNQNGSYIKLENDTITLNATNIVSNCENYTVNANNIVNNAENYTVNATGIVNNSENYTVNSTGIVNNSEDYTVNASGIINNAENYTVNSSASFVVNSPSSSFDGGTVTNDSVSIDKTHVHLKGGGSSTQPPTP